MSQEPLFEDLPPAATPAAKPKTRRAQARVVRAVRNQVEMVPRTLDESLAEDHPARAIWAYLDELDLESFYASVAAVDGEAGRPATDPQVLLALWLLATSDGIGRVRSRACRCSKWISHGRLT